MNSVNSPKINEQFLSNIQGKDFVLYAGLLDLAHQHGLLKLEVEILQYPSKENGSNAICRAMATAKDGSVFSDIGDACPGNVNKKIAPHIIRMASTRAKGRALRDLCNIGMVCLEELADFDEVLEEGYSSGYRNTGNRSSSRGSHNNNTNAPSSTGHGNQNWGNANQQRTNTSNQNSGHEDQNKTPTRTNENNNGNGTSGKNENAPRMSEAQRRAVLNLAQRRGISEEDLQRMAQDRFGSPLGELSSTDASAFIRLLQQSA